MSHNNSVEIFNEYSFMHAWNFNLLTLSWKEEKRMCELETELKDVLIEMTAIKGVEEALEKLEGN